MKMLAKLDARGVRRWPSAVVFDLDGTLVDSSGDITASLNELLAIKHLTPFSVGQTIEFVGDGIAMLVERALRAKGYLLVSDELPALVARYHSIYSARLTNSTSMYTGALEIISELRAQGTRIGICTNKTEQLANGVIKGLRLRKYFDAIVGGRGGRPLKPSPIPLLDTLARLGVAAKDTIMVGDSLADVQCARAAGVAVIGVSFGYSRTPMSELGADITIDNYTEFKVACNFLRARFS